MPIVHLKNQIRSYAFKMSHSGKRAHPKAQRFFKHLWITAILGLGVTTSCIANDLGDTPRVIKIHEKISQKTLGRIQLTLTHFKNLDPFPAGLIVLLDSPGGDGDAAMAIGRVLRQNNAHIFVTRRCDSACVFILMGGVVRAANPGSVGVHSGRLTVMTHDGNVIKEIDASNNLNNAFQLTSFNTAIRQYLREMGIQHGILDVMLSQSPNRLYKLTARDLQQFNVNGVDKNYLNQRLSELSQQGYISNTTPDEFIRRTLSTPKQCGQVVADDRRFINCYGRVLQGRSL